MGALFNIPPIKLEDVREFAEFLNTSEISNEKKFHTLIERHPALIGVIGYIRFLSEYSIPKYTGTGEISKSKDRPDILAVRPSQPDSNILYLDIIELKPIGKSISSSHNGQRLSNIALGALTQLDTYERELISNEGIKKELKSFGFSIASPNKILIFGRDSEFSKRPYDYEIIKDQFIKRGVIHYTADDLLRAAQKAVDEGIGSFVSKFVTTEQINILLAGDTNWKVSFEHQIMLAEDFSERSDIGNLYAWRKRNPGMIYVPYGYLVEANKGYVMCCPYCGSENIVSHTNYHSSSGGVIGDEADPCIVCHDCGKVDIGVNFRKA